jgi:hypothetical protein
VKCNGIKKRSPRFGWVARMRKKCLSCGKSFTLSGSGKRQKYCSNCSKRGLGHIRGLTPSKVLKSKVAESRFEEESVRAQIERKSCHLSPISFRTPEGVWGRVWLGVGGGRDWIIGDDGHWRCCIKRATEPHAPREPRTKAIISHAGFNIRLLLEDEAPEIGSGLRLVTVQFRGKKVKLHHWAYTATIKREAFNELVASNRRYRQRNQAKPSLRLIVGDLLKKPLDLETAA